MFRWNGVRRLEVLGFSNTLWFKYKEHKKQTVLWNMNLMAFWMNRILYTRVKLPPYDAILFKARLTGGPGRMLMRCCFISEKSNPNLWGWAIVLLTSPLPWLSLVSFVSFLVFLHGLAVLSWILLIIVCCRAAVGQDYATKSTVPGASPIWTTLRVPRHQIPFFSHPPFG